MTGCRLLIAAMLVVAGFFAAQATAGLGWATSASQTEDSDAAAQPTTSPDAAAANLYSANADLLARQLADGVRAGILAPFCHGLEAADSDPKPAACTTLGPRAAP